MSVAYVRNERFADGANALQKERQTKAARIAPSNMDMYSCEKRISQRSSGGRGPGSMTLAKRYKGKAKHQEGATLCKLTQVNLVSSLI